MDNDTFKGLDQGGDDVKKHGLGVQTPPDQPKVQPPKEETPKVEPANDEGQDGEPKQ